MHHPTDRIIHTTAFVTPVVEHWLEREIAEWVHHEGSSFCTMCVSDSSDLIMYCAQTIIGYNAPNQIIARSELEVH